MARTRLRSLVAPDPQVHHSTLLDAHLTSGTFWRKIRRETLYFCPSLPRGREVRQAKKPTETQIIALGASKGSEARNSRDFRGFSEGTCVSYYTRF